MTKYFTYVQGNNGPEPQIWYGELTDGGGKARPCLLTPIALASDDTRTIAELKLVYSIEAAT